MSSKKQQLSYSNKSSQKKFQYEKFEEEKQHNSQNYYEQDLAKMREEYNEKKNNKES